MELSAELKVPLRDVWNWSVDELYDWVAFYGVMEDRRKHKSGSKARRNRGS